MSLTSNSFESPAETRSLVASRLLELSWIAMSCAKLPELTNQKMTLPWETVSDDGANLYSLMLTWVEPAGCFPPLLSPQVECVATKIRGRAVAFIFNAVPPYII